MGRRIEEARMPARSRRGLRSMALSVLRALALALTAMPASAAETVPQFRDYPAGSAYRGPNAPLIMTTDQRAFRTRLAEAARQRPDFAGRYVIARWGCGTSCEAGAIYDAETGRVVSIPFSICCDQASSANFNRIVARLDSRLVVFAGLRNEEGQMGAHFYAFDGRALRFIKTIPDDGTFRGR